MSGATEAIGLANLTFGLAELSATEAADRARAQREIDATMREVIATANYNPTSREPMPTVKVVGAVPVKDRFAPDIVPAAPVRGSGWVEPKPLAPPPGQDAIERLVNAALPHGPKPAPAKPTEPTDAANADAGEGGPTAEAEEN